MASILKIVFLLILAVVKCECDSRTNAFDYDLYESVLNSEACEEELANMNAFEFYDASFRIPQGILTGSFTNLGNYHQCLAIKQQLTENRYIEGKFCMISIPMVQDPLPDLSEMSEAFLSRNLFTTEFNTTLPKLDEWTSMKKKLDVITGSDIASGLDESLMEMLNLNLALCIPKPCTVEEAIGPYFNNDIINVTYSEVFCRLPNDKPFAPADYVAIVILSLIAVLTVLSTGFDLYYTVIKKGSKNDSKLLRCCSIYNNTNRLLTFNKCQGTLDCLDGLRAISILWVVIGHTFLVRTSTYMNNSLKALDWISSPRSLWIMSAPIAVDTFLTLSGLLLVYTAANKMSATDLLKNLHLFYLNRLLRIFPLLALVVLLQASIFNHVSDGVSWYLVASQVDDCRKHWWTALLHLQNYIDMGTICVHPSWYLSVDMQLHILSPLLLFWMLKGRRSAWIALSIAILGSLTGTTIYCYINNFQPSTDHYSKYYYINTLTRCPPFIIGMLYGYVLNITRGKKVKLPTFSIVIGHLIALCLACFSIYHIYPISQSDWDNQWLTNFILSYVRTCWALSFGWLIFACINGYAGPINWLLSWNMWKLIARISYAMYLFHYPLQYILTGSLITPFHFSIGHGLSAFATDLAATLMTSIAACILIDAPFSTLQKLLFQSLSKQAKET